MCALINNCLEALEPLAEAKATVVNCDRAPDKVQTDPLRLADCHQSCHQQCDSLHQDWLDQDDANS